MRSRGSQPAVDFRRGWLSGGGDAGERIGLDSLLVVRNAAPSGRVSRFGAMVAGGRCSEAGGPSLVGFAPGRRHLRVGFARRGAPRVPAGGGGPSRGCDLRWLALRRGRSYLFPGGVTTCAARSAAGAGLKTGGPRRGCYGGNLEVGGSWVRGMGARRWTWFRPLRGRCRPEAGAPRGWRLGDLGVGYACVRAIGVSRHTRLRPPGAGCAG